MTQEDIQRSLGRIEGTQTQILSAISAIKEDFLDHKGEDRQNFQAVSSRFGAVYSKLEEQDASREASFEGLDAKLTILNGYVDNIKGAWWMVALLVAVVAAVGGSVAWVWKMLRG